MMKLFGLVAVSACAQPVIEMRLQLPDAMTTAALLDTKCLQAVEVHAVGLNFPQDRNDKSSKCLAFSGTDYDAVAAAIRGKFTLEYPKSGLSGIEMFGWAAPTGIDPCKPPTGVHSDAVFYSSAPYDDSAEIDLKLNPNIGCASSQLNVRFVDMLALVQQTTPNCAMATAPDGSVVSGGTIVANQFEKGVTFYGAFGTGMSVGDVATFDGYNQVDLKTHCLAMSGGLAGAPTSTSCFNNQPVCAMAGEIEHPIISSAFGDAARNLDGAVFNKWKAVVVGEAWNAGTTKTPAAGARVDIDPGAGEVIYVDPPATGATPISRRSDGKTGPSGMFLVFTNTLAQIQVTIGSRQKVILVGSPQDSTGTLLIAL